MIYQIKVNNQNCCVIETNDQLSAFHVLLDIKRDKNENIFNKIEELMVHDKYSKIEIIELGDKIEV